MSAFFCVVRKERIGEWSILSLRLSCAGPRERRHAQTDADGAHANGGWAHTLPCTSSRLEISNRVLGSISRSYEEVVGKAERGMRFGGFRGGLCLASPRRSVP